MSDQISFSLRLFIHEGFLLVLYFSKKTRPNTNYRIILTRYRQTRTKFRKSVLELKKNQTRVFGYATTNNKYNIHSVFRNGTCRLKSMLVPTCKIIESLSSVLL